MSEFGPPGFLPPDAFDSEAPRERELPLTDEQQVFIDCIEDVLRAADGLIYHKLVDPAMTRIRARTLGAYAVFLIETNPVYDLHVSIELAESDFVLLINGIRFTRKCSGERSFERWVDQCCRLLTRLTEGDLRIKQSVVLGVPQSTSVSIKRGSAVHELCKNESGWFSAMTWFVPFGLGVLFSGEQTRDYRNWYHSTDTSVESDSRAPHLPESTNGDGDERL